MRRTAVRQVSRAAVRPKRCVAACHSRHISQIFRQIPRYSVQSLAPTRTRGTPAASTLSPPLLMSHKYLSTAPRHVRRHLCHVLPPSPFIIVQHARVAQPVCTLVIRAPYALSHGRACSATRNVSCRTRPARTRPKGEARLYLLFVA